MGGSNPSEQDRYETVLKRRKKKDRAEILQAQKAAKQQRSAQRKVMKKIKFVRAERLVKDARRSAADKVRLRALSLNRRNLSVPKSQKLILAIRVTSVKGTADSIRKILKLLRLTKPNTAVFVPATPSTLQMLKRVEPYIAYGFPTLKTVRDLVYKHGQGRVGDKAVTLTDNALIEKELGEHNVICIEDIVHEIATVGESFRAVNRFLQPFKLKRPTERWKNERKKFVEDDELGFSAEKINEVIERMS